MVDEIAIIELTFIKINNLTLFKLKDLVVTEKSITFAKELTIRIKIGGN